MAETAQLRVDGKTLELPIVEGSEGERGIDISTLRAKTGFITLDPGYANTGSCRSAITFIDGEKGILRYRGIPIEQLAAEEHLPRGRLPADLREAADAARSSTRSWARSRSTRCCTRTSSASSARCRRTRTRWRPARPRSARSSTFYPDSLDPRNERQVEISVHRLIAKMTTMAAYAYKHSIGQPFIYPEERALLRRRTSCT